MSFIRIMTVLNLFVYIMFCLQINAQEQPKPYSEDVFMAGEVFKDCLNCPEMMVIPKGSFMMGDIQGVGDPDEKFIRRVTFTSNFAVGKFEVTHDEWEACVAEKACRPIPYQEDSVWGKGRRPATHTFREDTLPYLVWLSKKTGRKYRLLSEAEFEYVARAGSQTKYSWGNEIGIDKANCSDCVSLSKRGTEPVGTYAPNKFGVFDMHGNQWEVVEDCYVDTYEGAPTDGTARVIEGCQVHTIRGGGWHEDGWNMRAANRRNTPSSDVRAQNTLSFRVATSDLSQKN